MAPVRILSSGCAVLTETCFTDRSVVEMRRDATGGRCHSGHSMEFLAFSCLGCCKAVGVRVGVPSFVSLCGREGKV